MADNLLYYGDNLDVLRLHVKDESVDLIYLDPPFNSKATYNMLFAEKDGTASAAQFKAFEDTWHWDRAAADTFVETAVKGGKVSAALQAFQLLLGENDMLAYLTMMAPRLVELRRVLKPTGSIYLHCDPTAGHYLRVLMDAIFGSDNFGNEIIWRRTNARSTTGRWPRVHDVLLYYTKGRSFAFNPQKIAATLEKLPHHLITMPDGTKRQTFELTAPGTTKHGDSGLPWRGFDPNSMGRHWANSECDREAWAAGGLIHWPKRGGFPRRLAAETFDPSQRKLTVDDIWTDIDRINQSAKERLGYPTQKPEALLERILRASSKEGDTILDPFCGCGTAVAAAQRLGRRWIGMDITHLAIGLIKRRLLEEFQGQAAYKVVGEPASVEDARVLAATDPYQFQWWALGLVGARPVEEKKGADHGIDGRLYFVDDQSRTPRQVILSVKAGSVTVSQLRNLAGVIDHEKAAIGVLITMNDPTQPMRTLAASSGYYDSPWGGHHPRLQILTITDLLDGKGINYPAPKLLNMTYGKAPVAKRETGTAVELPLAAASR